jgi:predicted lipoprotein with Yx(FWY)xxD motif
MKLLLIAIGVLAATTMSAYAADPGKMVDTKLGKAMATQKGMMLYTFDKDATGKSNCDAACLKMWPAYHAGAKAKAKDGWTLISGTDGKMMWAYDGKPLYTYSDDKPGETKGDGVGGVWHLAK